jgi:hypothetical protein
MARAFGVLVLLFAVSLPAAAGQARASFPVSVRVPARASITAVESAGDVHVSAADIARGYKEFSTRYRVVSTGARGYLLQIAPRIGLARHIEVGGLGGEVVIGDSPVEIHRPAAGRRDAAGADDLVLALRVVLDPEARPGRYPLPLELAALPL